MNNCQKFKPNLFNSQKCSNCFKLIEEHSQSEIIKSNKEFRKTGYLFVAPSDWDFTDSHTRTRRWQRRFFCLNSDGLLTYSLDEHPSTIPQSSIKLKAGVTKIKRADADTDHEYSLEIRVEEENVPLSRLYVKAMCRDEMNAWQSALNQIINNHGILRRSNTSPIVYLREGGSKPSHNRLNSRFLSAKEFPKQLSESNPILISDDMSLTSSSLNSSASDFKDLNFNLKIRGDPDGSNNSEIGPLRKGWLLRYDNEDKNWLKNWFVLKLNELTYFKNVEETDRLDSIHINTESLLKETDSSKHYSFQIINGSETYHLAAITNGMRNIWLKSIESAKNSSIKESGLTMVNKSPIMKPRRNISKKGELEQMKLELAREREKAKALEAGYEGEILTLKSHSEQTKKELEYKTQEMNLIRERLDDLTEKLYQSEKNAKTFKNKFARIKSQSLKDKQSEIELLNKVRSLEQELTTKSTSDETPENHSIWFHCQNCDELEKKLDKRESELQQLEEQLSHLEEHFDNQLKDISISNVKYKKDLVDLQEIIGKTLEILEDSKNRLIVELEEKHRREIQKLKLANEEALREETAATMAALESLKRSHEIELKRQMEKFKADFMKNSDKDRLDEMHQQHENDLTVIQKQIKEITSMYTNKCLEFNQLQDKLKGSFNHIQVPPQKDQ